MQVHYASRTAAPQQRVVWLSDTCRIALSHLLLAEDTVCHSKVKLAGVEVYGREKADLLTGRALTIAHIAAGDYYRDRNHRGQQDLEDLARGENRPDLKAHSHAPSKRDRLLIARLKKEVPCNRADVVARGEVGNHSRLQMPNPDRAQTIMAHTPSHSGRTAVKGMNHI